MTTQLLGDVLLAILYCRARKALKISQNDQTRIETMRAFQIEDNGNEQLMRA